MKNNILVLFVSVFLFSNLFAQRTVDFRRLSLENGNPAQKSWLISDQSSLGIDEIGTVTGTFPNPNAMLTLLAGTKLNVLDLQPLVNGTGVLFSQNKPLTGIDMSFGALGTGIAIDGSTPIGISIGLLSAGSDGMTIDAMNSGISIGNSTAPNNGINIEAVNTGLTIGVLTVPDIGQSTDANVTGGTFDAGVIGVDIGQNITPMLGLGVVGGTTGIELFSFNQAMDVQSFGNIGTMTSLFADGLTINSGFTALTLNGSTNSIFVINGTADATLLNVDTDPVWDARINGDLHVAGLIKMGGSIYIDGSTPNDHSILADDNLTFGTNAPDKNLTFTTGTGGVIILNSPLQTFGNMDMQDNLILNIGNANTDFTATGGLNLAGNLKVGTSSVTIDGNASTNMITSTMPMAIGTVNNDSLLFQTNGTTQMMVARNGYVGMGTINPKSPLHIVGTPPSSTVINAAGFYTPDPYNHVLTVENLQSDGKGNGVAIVIHNPKDPNILTDGAHNDNRTNFITFYNDAGTNTTIRGRIEGWSYQNYLTMKEAMETILDAGELFNPFNYFQVNLGWDPSFISYNSNFLTFDESFIHFTEPSFPTLSGGSLPSLSIDWGDFDFDFNKGSLPSLSGGSTGGLTFESPVTLNGSPFTINGSPITNIANPISLNQTYIDTKSAQLRALPYKDKVAEIAFNPVAAAVKFGTSFLAGVTYETGSGDYAEWLERENHNDKLTIGDVVGVRAGKISKNTEGTNQYMVISFKPAVLGNMPEEGKEAYYEKCAFMGQVPVKLIGECKKGDYIIPSGRNNGFARSISAEKITSEDLGKVLGVAWEDATGYEGKIIKIAVGLKPHEMVKVIQDQAREIADLKMRVSEIDVVKQEIADIKVQLSKTAKFTSGKKKSKARRTVTAQQ